ncbi:hypothetical protein V2A60_003502 [Cordyceps javanica]
MTGLVAALAATTDRHFIARNADDRRPPATTAMSMCAAAKRAPARLLQVMWPALSKRECAAVLRVWTDDASNNVIAIAARCDHGGCTHPHY